MREILGSIEAEYRRYKLLAERAIEQVDDENLSRMSGPAGNSIATLVWHVSGNLASRFTDFLRTDGEKPWRDRESEFTQRTVSRAELSEKWKVGWDVLFQSLSELEDEHLRLVVTIRGLPLPIIEALHRSLAHASYHVGQLVFLVKELRGGQWRYLSIPPGGSEAYNDNPVAEKPPRSSQ